MIAASRSELILTASGERRFSVMWLTNLGTTRVTFAVIRLDLEKAYWINRSRFLAVWNPTRRERKGWWPNHQPFR